MGFGQKLEEQLSSGDFLRIEENPLPGFTTSITQLLRLHSHTHMHCLVTGVGNNGRWCYVPAGRRLRHTHTPNQVGACCPCCPPKAAAHHQKPAHQPVLESSLA